MVLMSNPKNSTKNNTKASTNHIASSMDIKWFVS